MWSVCGISFLTVMASAVNAITVNPTYPLKNGLFTLTAAATGSSFTWVKDSIVLTGCNPPIDDCDFPTPNIMPNANITVDGTAQVSTISVSNASQMLNGGLYGATGSVSTRVIVSTLPTSVQWKSHPVNGSSVDTGKWIAETSCVYPYDNITIDFKIFVEGVLDSVERISTSSKPESCVSPERVVLAELELYSNAYANERVYIVANASHDFFPNLAYVDGDQSNVVIFTAKSPDSPESSNVPIIVGAAGGSFLLIVMLLVMLLVYKKYSRKEQMTQGTHCALPASKTPDGKGKQMVAPSQKTQVRTGNQLEQSRPEDEPQIDYPKGMPLKPEGQLKIKTKQDYVEFQWKPPKSNGGSHITEYIVDVHGINFGTWATFATSSKTKLQVPIEKFKNDEVMSFRVRAKNENGSSEPLLAQKPFTLQNSHDLLSDRPVATNQGRGHEGFLPRNSVGTEHKESSLLEKVPMDRTLPKPV